MVNKMKWLGILLFVIILIGCNIATSDYNVTIIVRNNLYGDNAAIQVSKYSDFQSKYTIEPGKEQKINVGWQRYEDNSVTIYYRLENNLNAHGYRTLDNLIDGETYNISFP